MDSVSSFVMSVSRTWWWFVAATMETTAFGVTMWAWAMVDLWMPWLGAVVITVASVFVAWIAQGVKRRYLRWYRPEEPNIR